MLTKYKLYEDVYVRIDMKTAFIYDGSRKQIYRIPIILGLILDSVRTNALTIEEIQNEVLATLINDPNIQTYKEKVKYFISNLLDKGLIVIEKEE